MKKTLILATSCFIFSLIVLCKNASAQWYLDTATPEEAAARDKPYRYMQDEIQKKLCNADWEMDKNSFRFLANEPNWRKVLRGGGISRFDLTGGGDGCIIELKESSSLFKHLSDKEDSNAKQEASAMKWSLDNSNTITERIEAKYAKKKDFTMADAQNEQREIKTAQENFNRTHRKTIDSLNALNTQLKKSDTHLFNENEYADISMTVNDDRIQGKDLQDFRAFRVEQLRNIPGVQQAIFYAELPDEDNPDTSYRIVLYIGNFPKYTGKMEGVTFKSVSKIPWKDKQHSGKTVVENISVWISAYHYNNILKVLHSIDWRELNGMVMN